MNRFEFVVAARREGIRDGAYSLEGGFPSERYVLSIESGGWSVYYAERGEKVGDEHFDTEDDACTWLLFLLMKSSATHDVW